MIDVTFYFPCLTNHLTNNYNLSVSIASLFFIIPVITYITILQFLDKITAKYGIYITFTCGLICATISPLFIYPCSPLPKSLITIIIGFLIIGLGGGPVFIPGLVAMSKNIRIIDQNIDELTANDIASAINNLTISIGDFTGPIIGGFFTTRFNFKNCCYYVFFIGTINLLLFTCYFYNNIKDDIIKVLSKNKKENKVSEKINLFDKIKDNKDDLINEEILDNQHLNKSVLNSNYSFLDKLKIESLSLRRNSFANKFKRKEKISKISLYSSLTN